MTYTTPWRTVRFRRPRKKDSEGFSWQTRVALAGVLSAALLGVGGWVATIWVSGKDRDTQRSIAHEAHVYDRRADAYLAALKLVARQVREFDAIFNRLNPNNEEALHFLPILLMEGGSSDVDDISAQVQAFGSSRVAGDYRRMVEIVSKFRRDYLIGQEKFLTAEALHERFKDRSKFDIEVYDALQPVVSEAENEFVAAQDTFQRHVHAELD